MPTIKDALDIIGKLTVAEQESLKTMLLSPAFVKSLNIEDFVAKERFANGRVCPLCGCIHVVRNGHRKDGTQRYVCKDCGKSFVIATNSIVSGTRKDLSVWEQYIDCMMNGLSIRKTAVACGIHRNTAFLWRHKILDALQNMADDVTLDGIIEADETFFAISYKGNHSKSKTFAMPRKAHKRGHSTHIRGLSQEKVCVPCAVNRNGLSISKITNTGRVSTRDLHHIYDGRIKTNSTLVTDKMNSYVRFTNANGIDLVQLKTGKAKKGIYNIQHINSYHRKFRRFLYCEVCNRGSGNPYPVINGQLFLSCLREPRRCLRARNQPNIDQFVQQFFKRVIAVQTPYFLSVDELVGLHFRRQRSHHGQGHHANKKLAAHCGVAVHAGRMQIQACLQARECFLNAVPSSINRQGLLRVFHLVAYEGKEAHVTHFGVDCIVITNESTAIVAEHKQGLQGRLVRSVSALPGLLIFHELFLQ